ncbi:MAG: response regulator containing a CheY-like receiver domain and an DNA-binding domain [Sphingobacteriales bacterium]|nr:response regulator containing a CheY-like receiver domain and an DNA-binding domain [Sphingobacteriales bacterium]
MSNLVNFIIIDDDAINNIICTYTINELFPEADIQSFTEPEKGLEYIQKAFSEREYSEVDTILLLDLNMPTMTGWEVLQSYEKLSDQIKEQIKIFILSSSLDRRDKERAKITPHVIDILEKPLSMAKILPSLNS